MNRYHLPGTLRQIAAAYMSDLEIFIRILLDKKLSADGNRLGEVMNQGCRVYGPVSRWLAEYES